MRGGGQRQRNAVLEAVEAFRDREPTILLNSMLAFLYVSENEGLGVKELAYLCQLNEATTSRAIRALASPEAPGALPPALGLVVLLQNPRDARGRLIFLTDAGRELCERIDSGIVTGVSIREAAGRGPNAASVE
jgi:DNA-binding MarR family transcriptional regulator